MGDSLPSLPATLQRTRLSYGTFVGGRRAAAAAGAAVIGAWPYRGHASVTERSSAATSPVQLLEHGPELVAKSITLREV